MRLKGAENSPRKIFKKFKKKLAKQNVLCYHNTCVTEMAKNNKEMRC
jgi:hypothetical protein